MERDRKPGIREQHLLRKKDNPLFSENEDGISNDRIYKARLEDDVAAREFMENFRKLMQEAVDLKPNTPSDTILELKERLDQAYQHACALPGDTGEVKNAIRKLLDLMMKSVRDGAGADQTAQQKLLEEDAARKAHFELQEIGLVAALTHDQSPIAEDELIPSLLSETEEILQITLALFDPEQLALILKDAEMFLNNLDSEHYYTEAWSRLNVIRQQLARVT